MLVVVVIGMGLIFGFFYVLIFVVMLVGVLVGGLVMFGLIFLKICFGVDEVVIILLFNFVILLFV